MSNGFNDREAGRVEKELEQVKLQTEEIKKLLKKELTCLEEEVEINTWYRKVGFWVFASLATPIFISTIIILIQYSLGFTQ